MLESHAFREALFLLNLAKVNDDGFDPILDHRFRLAGKVEKRLQGNFGSPSS